jgi:cytochrome c oxidase subunit 3
MFFIMLFMLSIPRIYTYGIHSSYVSFYIAASLFNGFLLIYSSLWLNAHFVFVLVSLVYMFVVVSYWVNDLLIESFLYFNLNELSVLYLGFKLFILSELMIFLSLFGSYLNHTLLSLTFSSLFIIYFAIPFSNLLILLYSSFSIQSALIFMKFGFLLNMVEGLSQTVGIGILFVILQFKEFLFSIYTYSTSFIGTILYFTTGLHGVHVIIGLLLLLFSFYVFLMFSLNSSLRTSHTIML